MVTARQRKENTVNRIIVATVIDGLVSRCFGTSNDDESVLFAVIVTHFQQRKVSAYVAVNNEKRCRISTTYLIAKMVHAAGRAECRIFLQIPSERHSVCYYYNFTGIEIKIRQLRGSYRTYFGFE